MSERHSCRIALILICAGLFLPAPGCQREGRWTASEGSHTPLLPEGEPWNFQQAEGLVIQTPHYLIRTTVQDAMLLEKLPKFLEETYRQYEGFLPPAEDAEDNQEPFEIYLFARRAEWEAYTRENTGLRAEQYLKIRAGGYSHDGVCVTYLLERYHTFGVLAHEGFHQFSRRRLNHRIPAWMEEGLACNFEAHVWKAGRPYFTPDLDEFRIKDLKRALLNDWLFPLPELLATNAGEAVAMPPERTATFYAQAWALTRFLQEGENGKYRSAFRQMIQDAASGANLASAEQASDVFQSYFKTDTDALAGEFDIFAHLLANRHIKPGVPIIVISSNAQKQEISVTEEQIRQAMPVLAPEPPYHAPGPEFPEETPEPQVPEMPQQQETPQPPAEPESLSEPESVVPPAENEVIIEMERNDTPEDK